MTGLLFDPVFVLVQSWAQFMQPGDIAPAISVDPDPAKRPECIVIRMDQAMVDQSCALNQNYHEMLSQKMQRNYQFNTPSGVVRSCCRPSPCARQSCLFGCLRQPSMAGAVCRVPCTGA